MKIIGIDHVQLAMPAGEESRALQFYSQMLGLQEAPKPTELAKRGGVWFESTGIKIHLGVEADFSPAHKAHPGILVVGLAQFIERLRAGGYEVIEDNNLPGYSRIFTADPFGNRIELLERDTTSMC